MRLRFDSPIAIVDSLFKLLGALIALTVAVYIGLYVFAPRKLFDTAISLERMRGGFHRSELDIPGFHIVYLEGGKADAPPLLLLHGIGADKDNWTRIGALTRRYRVYAVDLPGFGESGKPADAGYRIEDQIPRVAAIATALGLKQFDLGGNSMGGWISVAYAIRHREQVTSLWLLDPGGVANAEDSEMITRIKAGEPVPLFAQNREEFRALLAFAMTTPPFIPTPVETVLVERQAANHALNLAIFQQLREHSQPLDAQLAALTPPLETPTLIVWGAQDRVLHVSGAGLLHAMLPNSKVITMPGIGHLPMLEAPGDVVRDYIAFRDGLAAAAPAAGSGSASGK
jgi:pimeloyl-ACP methyl ester carboxylesterase